MAGKRRRSAPSTPRPRSDRSERAIQNRSALLETINGFYAAALGRLPVDEMPALVPRLLKAGLCVGFSDPVTNIIVNTVATCSRRVPDRNNKVVKEKAAERRRRKALSRAAADTGNVGYWSPRRSALRDMPVAARSLEALIAFLTYYFRYLPISEALEYLILANADVLAAVRLVEADRHYSFSFRLDSRTTRTAFRCAALASCHPKPRALVNRLYIDALARLPRDMLQKRYHRGLLKDGHCYGPLQDPVSNIVLNTVWYETVFPPQKRLSVSSVSMISSRSLVRVACRSLRGLVDYLRACFRMVSDHQAMRYLLFSDANIWERWIRRDKKGTLRERAPLADVDAMPFQFHRFGSNISCSTF
ncbi:hypothetical protein QOZ80_3AG0226240 [Eleusine coracana subsp. coracana]|nr:hypothetical protein QOZ80_3AG0226240 [Eleusine coracana subsp. coracana]